MRDDPLFERLQFEINKLESPSESAVNWKEMVDLCREILKERSKDLLVASYLVLGLFEEKGYAGLVDGLACTEGLVLSFWESLYPEVKRMRARMNAIEWLSERVGGAVARKMPQAADKGKIETALVKLDALELHLKERGGATFGILRLALKSRLAELEFSGSERAISTPSSERAKEPLPPAGQTVREVGSVEQAEGVLKEAVDEVQRAAVFVRSQDPADPWPYRAVRALAWLKLDHLPVTQDSKKKETPIPPPPPHLMERYRQLQEKGAWLELVEQIESHFQTAPFWIDPHRFSAQALTYLGPPYAKAKEAVVGELLIFLRRLPGLLECRFSDGTLWADEETQQWVRKDLLPALNGSGPSQAMEASAESMGGQMAEVRKRAELLVEKGEMKEAIGLLKKERERISSPRIRFLMSWQTAKLCLQAGYPQISFSLFEGMEKEIDRYSLEQWEPALCLQIYRDERETLDRLMATGRPTDPDWARRAEEIHRKICRLDPVLGMELEATKRSGWFGRS